MQDLSHFSTHVLVLSSGVFRNLSNIYNSMMKPFCENFREKSFIIDVGRAVLMLSLLNKKGNLKISVSEFMILQNLATNNCSKFYHTTSR